MSEINCKVPVAALRGLVIMPGEVNHFDAQRKETIAAVEAAMLGDQKIALFAQKDPEAETVSSDGLCNIGVYTGIRQIVRLENNAISVLVEGKYPARIDEVITEKPYLYCDIIVMNDEEIRAGITDDEKDAMRRTLTENLDRYRKLGIRRIDEIENYLKKSGDVFHTTDLLCAGIPVEWEQRQRLLECKGFREKYLELIRTLEREYEVLKITTDIQKKVKVNLDKNQKDYILREQIRVIREELGDEGMTDAEEYEEKLASFRAPKAVKDKIGQEIRRLKLSGPGADSGVYRNYIETMFDMPWYKHTRENKDINKAEKILREDHYGLEKVKTRILEYLSVRMLTGKGRNPILCLVGPPGTGKTSIARSVARATGRKFARISLGGMHDEAEIRGHRKTYIGALPGRIAVTIRQAGVNNPVILLDEIDKVGNDYRGDVYSALLEVLDPEQNSNFRDNYLEVPLDLSNVLFLCTANTLQTVPRPLLDRMEIIEINTYTENEKMHIAKEHLISKQMETNGLTPKQLSISDKAIRDIILYYTRESGVRELERQIGEICMRASRMIIQDGRKSIRVTDKNLTKILGTHKFEHDMANEVDQVGIVRGLAWTSVGGETLSVEVNIMPGKGEVRLTGQLGDVMKESAMAGISYLRSIADRYGIDKEYFEQHDIHIHIPEGAVPKDGPSAGVTMATAVLSAILNIPVRADVAMTGEITLRGRVLPIGGLREKSIAAKVAGIHTVLVPDKNRKDIDELDPEIKDGMKFIYVSSMDEIIPRAFAHLPEIMTEEETDDHKAGKSGDRRRTDNQESA